MKLLDSSQDQRLQLWLQTIRSGNDFDRIEATDALLKHLVELLPEAQKRLSIAAVRWSNGFVTNARWLDLWKSLGVSVVADLGRVGRTLAQAKGIGQTKILALIQDLMDLAGAGGSPNGSEGPERRMFESFKRNLAEIEQGAPTPAPHRVGSLLRVLVTCLPPGVRALPIDSVPWSSQWCYTTTVWTRLGVNTVADLGQAGAALARSRGIGRGKVVSVARDLVWLCPSLELRLNGARRNGKAVGARPALQCPDGTAPAGRLVRAIDRFAASLEPREADVLLRRVGWRYAQLPEKLKVLAHDHSVTQERIRQIEEQLCCRLERLLRLEGLPTLLRAALDGKPGPVDFATIVTCLPDELAGIMDLWRPLAPILGDGGGPYLIANGNTVMVSAVPLPFRRDSLPTAPVPRSLLEMPRRWPQTAPPSLC